MSNLDSGIPSYNFVSNPGIIRPSEFMRLQTPIGLRHAPWGHDLTRRS